MDIVSQVNSALEYTKQKKYEEAERIYLDTLSKDENNAVVLSLLGLMYINCKKLKKAEKVLQKSYNIKPSIPTIEGLGIVKGYLGKTKEAGAFLEQVIDKTKNFDVFDRYIDYLLSKKQNKKAYEYALKCQKLYPLKKESMLNLVNCQMNTGMLKEAFKLCEQLVKSFPQYSEGWLKLGLIYEMLFHDDDMAYQCFKNVLELGNKKQGYHNLGINAYKRGDYDSSLDYLFKLKKIAPKYLAADFSISTAYMKKRCFKQGIKYYSKYILESGKKDDSDPIKNLKNLWDGKKYKNETLMIWGDQGVGDLIMFSRYIFKFKDYFKEIKLCLRPSVKDLFKNVFKSCKNIKVYSYKGRFPKYDKSAIMSCLPWYLEESYKNIPYSEGYMDADKKIIERYREQLDSKKLNIGICWEAGGSAWREQLNRTLNISLYEPFLDIKNVQFYSLQVKPTMDNYKDYKSIIDWGCGFKDFNETAGAIKSLDLIVSVDTSVAHLAGALGVKTFLILPYCSDWRWFDDTKTTSWYKSVTLFKQDNPKSWDNVMEDIKEAIERIVDSK